METIENKKVENNEVVKYNVEALKKVIKVSAEAQKFYKNQRKTVNLVGERKIEPWAADVKHHYGREDLRLLYSVYAIVRGKNPKDIDRGYDSISKYVESKLQKFQIK